MLQVIDVILAVQMVRSPRGYAVVPLAHSMHCDMMPETVTKLDAPKPPSEHIPDADTDRFR